MRIAASIVTFGLPLAHEEEECLTRTYWSATSPSVAGPVGLAVPPGFVSVELTRLPVTITSFSAAIVSGVL